MLKFKLQLNVGYKYGQTVVKPEMNNSELPKELLNTTLKRNFICTQQNFTKYAATELMFYGMN
jgi:hypothetical protein